MQSLVQAVCIRGPWKYRRLSAAPRLLNWSLEVGPRGWESALFLTLMNCGKIHVKGAIFTILERGTCALSGSHPTFILQNRNCPPLPRPLAATSLGTSYEWSHIVLVFSGWFVSLSMTSSRSIRAAARARVSFLSEAEG